MAERDPLKIYAHVESAVRFNPKAIRAEMAKVEGFNAKLAVLITRGVGTMGAAYIFTALALVSAPAALTSGNTVVIVSWISQAFLQLVLLPIIIVGQNVQGAASDARAIKTFQDTEVILDRLDTKTAGGIKDVLDAIERLKR